MDTSGPQPVNKAVLLIGDFGTATVREIGVHDSVFLPQDLDTAKWNTNSDSDIANATTVPHVTVLGTGDGNPDFYAFEITQPMLDAEFLAEGAGTHDGIRVSFDIDHGYDFGDSKLWVSALKLYELKTPLDPTLPKLPNLIAQGGFFNWNIDQGSTYYFDAALEQQIKEPGIYYIEVTAAYPFGIDGLPEGVDYQLHVSIPRHAQDSFVFAPAPVSDQETSNDTVPGGQVLESGTNGGDNFFRFFDPNVGHGDINYTTPYVRIEGAGDQNFSYDVYRFDVQAAASGITPDAASTEKAKGKSDQAKGRSEHAKGKSGGAHGKHKG